MGYIPGASPLPESDGAPGCAGGPAVDRRRVATFFRAARRAGRARFTGLRLLLISGVTHSSGKPETLHRTSSSAIRTPMRASALNPRPRCVEAAHRRYDLLRPSWRGTPWHEAE